MIFIKNSDIGGFSDSSITGAVRKTTLMTDKYFNLFLASFLFFRVSFSLRLKVYFLKSKWSTNSLRRKPVDIAICINNIKH